jgi:hypothetical protein
MFFSLLVNVLNRLLNLLSVFSEATVLRIRAIGVGIRLLVVCGSLGMLLLMSLILFILDPPLMFLLQRLLSLCLS